MHREERQTLRHHEIHHARETSLVRSSSLLSRIRLCSSNKEESISRFVLQDYLVSTGSPAGLQDSVTMAVVSTAARQLDPDNPMVYVQSAACTNPANNVGHRLERAGQVETINMVP